MKLIKRVWIATETIRVELFATAILTWLSTLITIIYANYFDIEPFAKWYVISGYNFIWVLSGVVLARIYSWCNN